jgi:hypothetical protein
MFELVAEGAPSSSERRLIEQIKAGAFAACEQEGLDARQVACIMSAKGPEDLVALGNCDAIKARRPSWLRLP